MLFGVRFMFRKDAVKPVVKKLCDVGVIVCMLSKNISRTVSLRNVLSRSVRMSW